MSGIGGQDAARQRAAIDDPAFGADPTFTLPGAPDQVEARSPAMTEMPAGGAGFGTDDLLTEEEVKAKMAELLGMDPTELGAEPPDHNENLVDKLDQNWLNATGQEITEHIEADLESRRPWDQRFKRGLEIVGLKDFVWEHGVAPFEGASNAVLPMLAEAIVQSQARFMEEIFPAAGPVKTEVMGVEDPEKRASADRVQDHMNFQLTIEDQQTYFNESQKLGLYLPIFGSAYRKAYHDFVEDRNVLRYIPGDDLILPYGARDLYSSPRKTHRFKLDKDEYARAVAAGAYARVELQDPDEAAPTPTEQEKNKLDSLTPVEGDKDGQWTMYETDMRLDVPGFEDKDDFGKPTGIALPYTVTTEKDSGKVLAIRRCWKKEDPLKLMRTRYAEYWYLPGLGVYGTGLLHWIGTIAESGTDALRALLDSATWANLQGGFKAKDAGTKAGEIRMKPGAWLDVDMTADELAKAFHTPPVREPSEALFKLLGFLVDQGRRFASTSDMMVGDQEAKGAPVGTTVALIEQGSKVYSGVHKRAHAAAGVEFRMLFDLNAEYIPAEGYPYKVPGDDKAVYQADYDTDTVGVVPVSDPNIFSQTQRIALAQTRYQISKDNPQYFNKYEVLKSLLKALKDPEIDANLVDPDKVPFMDPISENIAMATGRPVKAKDGENHDAHLIEHMAFSQHPQFGGLPQAQQLMGGAMIAHMAEHVALKYAQVRRAGGVPVPPINLSAPQGTPIAGTEDQGQTDQIAVMAAGTITDFMQRSGLTMTPPNQDDGAAKAAADDAHRESEANVFATIALGMANLAKAGLNLVGGIQAEGAVESGNPPAQQGAGGVGALGSPAPASPVRQPMPAPAPHPAPAIHSAPRPATAPRPAPVAPAPTPAPVSHPDAPPQHDENIPAPKDPTPKL